MTVSAVLIGAGVPQAVQVAVTGVPSGESYTVTGQAGDYVWQVPGGVGVSSGAQIILTDVRSPGNVPVTYTVVSDTVNESSTPVTVPVPGELVLQSLDGAMGVVVTVQAGSADFVARSRAVGFTVPGRARPVVRFDVASYPEGSLVVRAPLSVTPALKALFATGRPIVYRAGIPLLDMDPVAVVSPGDVSSRVLPGTGLREWSFPFLVVDDPFASTVLGGFSWDAGFDAALAGGDWDDRFDGLLAGLSWDEFDTLDWSTM